MGALRRWLDRLTESDEARLAAEVRDWADKVADTIRIGDAPMRGKVKIAGVIRRITVFPMQDHESLEAVVSDGTGQVTIVFMGRRGIGGLSLGTRVVVEGVLGEQRGAVRMINPRLGVQRLVDGGRQGRVKARASTASRSRQGIPHPLRASVRWLREPAMEVPMEDVVFVAVTLRDLRRSSSCSFEEWIGCDRRRRGDRAGPGAGRVSRGRARVPGAVLMAGWLQLCVLVVILVAAYRPLGDYMAWALDSPRTLRVERAMFRLAGVRPDAEQRWSRYATSLLAFSTVSVLFLYVLQRVQAVAAALARVPGRRAEPGVQHGRLVHVEHELAVVRGRVDDGTPRADGRPRRAELRVRGGRHRGRGGADPRVHAGQEPRRSATSGRTSCGRRSASCCRSRSSAPSCSCRRGSCRTSTRPAR